VKVPPDLIGKRIANQNQTHKQKLRYRPDLPKKNRKQGTYVRSDEHQNYEKKRKEVRNKRIETPTLCLAKLEKS
jgi:hypothetical protein